MPIRYCRWSRTTWRKSARLVDITETNHVDFGPGLCFLFEIVGGPRHGRDVRRFTAPTPTISNNLGRLLSGLTGKQLQKDETLDVEELLYKHYYVTVEQLANGKTRVQEARPVPCA